MSKKQKVFTVIGIIAAALAIFFSFWKIPFLAGGRISRLLGEIIPLFFGAFVVVLYLLFAYKKIFRVHRNLIYLLPCLIVAINNFPLISFINGVCVFDGVGIAEILLFILYCLLIGVLEECFFRGIILVWLTEIFKKNKTGLVKSMILSSCVFGLAHLFNLFGGAGVADTLLQVLYSALIGGLCAFAFFKTNNILCAVLIHFIYNVCGLLFNADIGLGTGVVYGTAAMIVTVIIGIAVGVFVVISLIRTKEEELYRFYDTVNIRFSKDDGRSS